ncbi:hypothetical protein AX16_000068 [Volvariella volvacea WC 439]|nr:hypothetical protein AX16_000068 [Volvariella volvacea WC 439]
MFGTVPRMSASGSSVARSLQSLLPKQLPPSLAQKPGNLYEILSKTPSGGVGKEVHQLRWNEKQISESFWLVTRTKFKCEGKHGKAWGKLYWKGKLVSPREERIPGSLKYAWAEGRSLARIPKDQAK